MGQFASIRPLRSEEELLRFTRGPGDAFIRPSDTIVASHHFFSAHLLSRLRSVLFQELVEMVE